MGQIVSTYALVLRLHLQAPKKSVYNQLLNYLEIETTKLYNSMLQQTCI